MSARISYIQHPRFLVLYPDCVAGYIQHTCSEGSYQQLFPAAVEIDQCYPGPDTIYMLILVSWSPLLNKFMFYHYKNHIGKFLELNRDLTVYFASFRQLIYLHICWYSPVVIYTSLHWNVVCGLPFICVHDSKLKIYFVVNEHYSSIGHLTKALSNKHYLYNIVSLDMQWIPFHHPLVRTIIYLKNLNKWLRGGFW